jgi:hypothetical protein
MPTVEELSQQLEDLKNRYYGASDASSKLSDNFKSLSGGLFDTTTNASRLIGSLNGIISGITAGTTSTEELRSSLTNIAPAAVLAAGAFGLLSGNLTDYAQKSGISSKSTTELSTDLKSLAVNAGKIPGIGAALQGVFKAAGEGSAAVGSLKQFENQLISVNATAGSFERAEYVTQLDKHVIEFAQAQTMLGNVLNLSSSEVSSYSQSLMKIPGAYKAAVTGGEDMNTQMSLTEAAVRIARGTTGDFDDALKAVDFTRKNFNKTGEESLDLLAQTYKATQNLGVSFDDLESPIKDISSQFKTFGDNTKSSINLVNDLGASLMKTGLGIGPTVDIIKNITSSIAGMGTAQKAFLSQQTGGSGGLRGSFEIDLLLQQGKMDEVYKKMEDSLKQQFGGPIVGIEEAAGNDVAAGQMQKQIAFLMEGPFGSLMKDQGQALKYLDALSSGTTSEKGVEGALQDAFNADAQQQNRQFDVTQVMANDVNQLLQISELTFALQVRKAVGSDNSEMARFINDLKEQGEGARTIMAGEQTTYSSPARAWSDSLLNVTGTGTNAGAAVAKGFMSVGASALNPDELGATKPSRGIAPEALPTLPSPRGVAPESNVTKPGEGPRGFAPNTPANIFGFDGPLEIILKTEDGTILAERVAKIIMKQQIDSAVVGR